jgi:hypothetical protein
MPVRPALIPEQVSSLRAGLSSRSGIRLASVLLWLLPLAPFAIPHQAGSAAPQSLEYQVKAAFLLNFTKFIEWHALPETAPDSVFTICILGEDPFGTVLDRTVEGETVNGRKLVVQRVDHISNACQILYISRSEKGSKELLGKVDPGTLTVGEGDGFTREGGMIAFVLDNRRVRFTINLSATRNALLTLSSRLLAVAKAVEK